MVGTPGSGKSTIALALAKHFNPTYTGHLQIVPIPLVVVNPHVSDA